MGYTSGNHHARRCTTQTRWPQGDGHMRTFLLLLLLVRAEKMMVGREKTSCCEGALHDFNCCFYITVVVVLVSRSTLALF